jgi:AcrR family transcriptional regulator
MANTRLPDHSTKAVVLLICISSQCNVTPLWYTVNMGRPREHDERIAAALLDAAERTVAEGGVEALSVRPLARAIGASTRAVYSLFGSKEGLIIALGSRAFTLLREGLDALPTTDDPARDLVEAGAVVFRRFALGHPALFSIGLVQADVPAELAREFRSVQEQALGRLHARIGRLKDIGRLGRRSEPEAALAFHALCEGLAAMEARCIVRSGEAEHMWRDALQALVAGWEVAG